MPNADRTRGRGRHSCTKFVRTPDQKLGATDIPLATFLQDTHHLFAHDKSIKLSKKHLSPKEILSKDSGEIEAMISGRRSWGFAAMPPQVPSEEDEQVRMLYRMDRKRQTV